MTQQNKVEIKGDVTNANISIGKGNQQKLSIENIQNNLFVKWMVLGLGMLLLFFLLLQLVLPSNEVMIEGDSNTVIQDSEIE